MKKSKVNSSVQSKQEMKQNGAQNLNQIKDETEDEQLLIYKYAFVKDLNTLELLNTNNIRSTFKFGNPVKSFRCVR